MKRIQLREGMSSADYNLFVQQHMTEDTWQNQVVKCCHDTGWKAVHIEKGKMPVRANQPATERDRREGLQWKTPVSIDGRGFPDLVVAKTLRIGRSALIVWELKIFGNRATAEQSWWLDFFRGLPGCIEASVRYPWELDAMTDILNRD